MTSEAFRALFVIIIPTIIISFIVFTAVHELGHLIFGAISGYKFKGMTLFGISVIESDGRLRLTRDISDDSTVMGQCILYPHRKDAEPNLCIEGGVIANVIASVVCFILIAACTSLEAKIIMFTAGLTSLALAALNQWFCIETGDGATARLFKKNGQEKLFNRILLTGVRTADGIPFGEMDIFDDSPYMPESSISAEYMLYQYYSALEQCNKKEILKRYLGLIQFNEEAGIGRDIAIEQLILAVLMEEELNGEVREKICGSRNMDSFLKYIQKYAKKNSRIWLLCSLIKGRPEEHIDKNIRTATYSGCWKSALRTFENREELKKIITEKHSGNCKKSK